MLAARMILLLTCVFCFAILLNRFRVGHKKWNAKTRDYWYALTMWTFASACGTAESLFRHLTGRYSIVLSVAAALVTLSGVFRKGAWGDSEDHIYGTEEGYLSPVLRELVPEVTYKPNWKIYVAHEVGEDGSGGWHLFVVSHTDDSLNPTRTTRVRHGFLIPAASYNRDTWSAWIFDRLRDVETHEAGEFFQVNGVREFAPHHSNGENPYLVWHVGDYATAAKSSGDD